MPSECLVLSEKPVTSTVKLQILLLIQEFLSKESEMLHRWVSAPKGRGDTFRRENVLSRKNEITAESLKILWWSARQQKDI